jgi:hypothetical protein
MWRVTNVFGTSSVSCCCYCAYLTSKTVLFSPAGAADAALSRPSLVHRLLNSGVGRALMRRRLLVSALLTCTHRAQGFMTPAATAVLRESTASCACVESQAATTATLPVSEAPQVRAIRGPTRVLSREEAAALPPAERWMRIAGPTQVLFSDEHIVVCSKESGLLSVPGIAVKDSLATRIAVQFDQDRIGELLCCVVLAVLLL